MADAPQPATLEEAQDTIARQAAEIERLRQRVEDDRFAEDLRDALVLSAAVGTIGSPVDHERLIEMIVVTAADVIGATAGSLFLIDTRTEELVFEVAIGPKAEAIKKFRVPLGEGVAGLVAVSGQPMAISNAQEDSRLFEELGDKVGHEPDTVLAVPLFYQDRVIGVLELLDKEGGATFTPQDISTLGLFANQAAVAIELSRTYRRLAPLVGEVLSTLDDSPGDRKASLSERSSAFAAHIEEEPSFQETLELAELVQEIAWTGDDELEACRTILRSFTTYLRSRSDPLREGTVG
ncbi:MAG: GAF domain-containing protein [Actinomycetota bacterium]